MPSETQRPQRYRDALLRTNRLHARWTSGASPTPPPSPRASHDDHRDDCL